MDDMPHEVGVHAGQPRPVWCGICCLPSAIAVPILTVEEQGVSVIGETSGCPECRTGFFADDPT